MTFADLLEAALFIERDPAHRQRVVEIGFVRIVEADVAIFAETNKGQIDRPPRQQFGVAAAFLVDISGIPGEVVNFARLHRIGEPGFHPIPEAGGMRGREADILIDVKHLDEAPIDFGVLNQFGNHLELRVAGGNKDACSAVFTNLPFQNRRRLPGRRGTKLPLVLIDPDGQIARAEFRHWDILTSGRGRTRINWVAMRIAKLLLVCTVLPAAWAQTSDGKPVRLAIAGLNHGHVSGFLRNAEARRNDVEIVAVYDPVPELLAKYAKSDGFADNLLFTDLAKMLDTVKPEAVAVFSDTFAHEKIVEACLSRHIPVMMEKPLAVDGRQALAMQRAADRYQTPVIVNYETTWYPAYPELWTIFHEQKSAGEIRRMVAETGHSGPKEIGVQPEFLAWLTDPVRNGAGALFDFGCYGADLMTWLMDGQRPLKVTAITQSDKPDIYARVDDEATILLEYPKAQGVIEASWNWPFDRKDFEVYGEHGSAITSNRGTILTVRLPRQREETRKPPERSPEEHDAISYFTAVVRGKLKPDGPSSLAVNVVVVEILEAARESARTGRTVVLAETKQ